MTAVTDWDDISDIMADDGMERRSGTAARKPIWDWLGSHQDDWAGRHPCYKCLFWEPWSEDAQDDLGMTGICRRYPPVFAPDLGTWGWPETGCKACCGEWHKRKKGGER